MPAQCPIFRRTSTQTLKKDVILHSALRANHFRRKRGYSEKRAIAMAYKEQAKCAYGKKKSLTPKIEKAIKEKMKTLLKK